MKRCITLIILSVFFSQSIYSQSLTSAQDSYDWKEIELKLNEYNIYDDYEESVFREKVGTHFTSYQTGTPSEVLEYGQVFRYAYQECYIDIIYNSVYHLDFQDSTLAINNLRVGNSLLEIKAIFSFGKIVEENEEKRYHVQIGESVLVCYLNNDNIVIIRIVIITITIAMWY